MPKAIKLTHAKSAVSISTYLKNLTTEQHKEARALIDLFTSTTNTKPKVWGGTMIGFGEYEYTRSNGDFGSYFATGFAIRKSGPTIYIMPGYQDYSVLLKDLGPHKLGKSCLYLKTLSDIKLPVLRKLIAAGLRDLKKTHTVTMQ
jgi:hypothetical protein